MHKLIRSTKSFKIKLKLLNDTIMSDTLNYGYGSEGEFILFKEQEYIDIMVYIEDHEDIDKRKATKACNGDMKCKEYLYIQCVKAIENKEYVKWGIVQW